jgi:hypothetical protein
MPSALSPEDPAVTVIRMEAEFLIASRLAAGQALFGLLLAAVLVLLRTRRGDGRPLS